MVAIDLDRCTGCGDCVSVCPHAALRLTGKPARSTLVAPKQCMECGACGLNCPEQAISGNFGVACFANMTSQVLAGKKTGCSVCGC